MTLSGLIESGGGHPVILFAIALLLGALHGLEPGHAKTMIAAFIIAVRGTVTQAVLLGLSAAVSHSIIVWLLAGAALATGNELIAESAEPYFMVASGAIVLVIAAWMVGRLQGERTMQPAYAGIGGLSAAALVHDHSSHGHDHGHPGHGHHYAHAEVHPAATGDDAHARAHAAQLRDRLAQGGRIRLRQTVVFGLTGGLIPCPAAVTVLLVCLHLDSVMLGVGLVSGFSLGLGITLVAIGVAAAWGSTMISKRSGLFDRWSGRLPYLSAGLIGAVGIAMMAGSLSHFSAH